MRSPQRLLGHQIWIGPRTRSGYSGQGTHSVSGRKFHGISVWSIRKVFFIDYNHPRDDWLPCRQSIGCSGPLSHILVSLLKSLSKLSKTTFSEDLELQSKTSPLPVGIEGRKWFHIIPRVEVMLGSTCNGDSWLLELIFWRIWHEKYHEICIK